VSNDSVWQATFLLIVYVAALWFVGMTAGRNSFDDVNDRLDEQARGLCQIAPDPEACLLDLLEERR
jgi:hypothetical protein